MDWAPCFFPNRRLALFQKFPKENDVLRSFILLLVLGFFGTASAVPPDSLLNSKNESLHLGSSENESFLIGWYKHYISPIDGKRCPMYPSCSHYSKEAFRRYGFFKGLILTFDRLIRCGSDLRHYREIRQEGTPRYVDPIEDNAIFIEEKK